MSRPAIPARVTRLLPLLSSPSDGEALNTRDAIVQTLAAVGLDLNDLAAAVAMASKPMASASHGDGAAPSFFDMARACRDLNGGRLNAWERGFVLDMCRHGRSSPSPRQAERLAKIFARVQRRAAA